MRFSDLIERIKTDNPPGIIIKNVPRKVTFVASYYTEHYPDEEYFKIFFSDETILMIIPEAESLYFCDDERREINRELITGYGEYLHIDGKEYLLDNGDDKQFVKKIYFGNIKDGEGKCVFSDYGFADEIWSLATLSDGEISDIHAKEIDLKDISFVNDSK